MCLYGVGILILWSRDGMKGCLVRLMSVDILGPLFFHLRILFMARLVTGLCLCLPRNCGSGAKAVWDWYSGYSASICTSSTACYTVMGRVVVATVTRSVFDECVCILVYWLYLVTITMDRFPYLLVSPSTEWSLDRCSCLTALAEYYAIVRHVSETQLRHVTAVWGHLHLTCLM